MKKELSELNEKVTLLQREVRALQGEMSVLEVVLAMAYRVAVRDSSPRLKVLSGMLDEFHKGVDAEAEKDPYDRGMAFASKALRFIVEQNISRIESESKPQEDLTKIAEPHQNYR